MSDIDISDLPAPDTDISDLPVPPKNSPTQATPPTENKHNTLQLVGVIDTHIPISDNLQNFLAGTGEKLSGLGSGIHQLAHKAGIASDNQEDIDDAAARDKALESTKAGMLGNIVGEAAPAVLLPEAGLLGSMVEGAGMGAAQPTVTGESSRLQNAGMGALGAAAGSGVAKFAKLVKGFGIPDDRAASVAILDREGIPTSVAQKTNSKAAQHIENASGAISNAQRDFEASQQPALNAAILRRVGVNSTKPLTGADVLTELPKARTAIKKTLDRVAANNNVQLDNQLLNELGQHQWDAARQIKASDLGPINTTIDDILENAAKNNGALKGEFFQKIYSSLGDLSKSADQAPIAARMRESLRQGLLRSAKPGDAAAYANALKQYRALKQIEPAVDDATGNIRILRLMQELGKKDNQNQALYGQGDQSLMELARAAAHVIPNRLANSGTPERALLPATAMEIAASGEPLKAAIKAGAGIYGGGALGRAMRSQGIVGKTLATGVPGLKKPASLVSGLAPGIGYAKLESSPRDNSDTTDRESHAAGGRTGPSDDELVERLMKSYRAAKRAEDASTKSLLKMPDAAIIHALKISGSGI